MTDFNLYPVYVNGQVAFYPLDAADPHVDAFTARTKVPAHRVPSPTLTVDRILRAQLEQKAQVLDLDLDALERAEIGIVAAETGHGDEGVRPHNNLAIVSEARSRVAQQVNSLFVSEGYTQ
jgi:hypothetical protein